MHRQADADPVAPRWQQSVVTVDDAEVAQVAQEWGAPFPIRYAASGADIRVSRDLDQSMVGGIATREIDGDRLTRCALRLRPVTTSAIIAHELGHCLGLHHEHHRAGTVMHWVAGDYEAGWSDTVTDFDRATLEALYGGSPGTYAGGNR